MILLFKYYFQFEKMIISSSQSDFLRLLRSSQQSKTPNCNYYSIKMCSSLTIKAAMFCTKLKQLVVSLHRRTKNKHTGVETVGPARVGCCGQLLSVKQLVYI